MSLLNPKPGGGLPSKLMREHINKMLPICPLCGSHEPLWTIHYRVDLLDGRVQFRCSTCDSAFSITQTDLLGAYKLRGSGNLLTHLYTWPLTTAEAIKKNLKGKDASTVYIKIDELGFLDESQFQKGQEVPIEELQKVANCMKQESKMSK